jgi:hypothetical protein
MSQIVVFKGYNDKELSVYVGIDAGGGINLQGVNKKF